MGGNRGRGGRSWYTGREGQLFRGEYQGRSGRGVGWLDNCGRGQGRGRHQVPNNDNLFIPPDVLAADGPRYQAMLFRGRNQMKKETKGIEQSTQNVSAVANDSLSQVGEITDNNNGTTAEELDGGASSHFGATGRKKQCNLGVIT
jgi:hypothetical protein